MPDRNRRFEAIVLRVRESPGGDKIATFLGGDEGIVDAFIFGSAKSLIRASVAPHTLVDVQIYTDPVKQYRRVSDVAILESYPGIRESYETLTVAGIISEVVMKTSGCGGEFATVMDLSKQALSTLSRGGSEAANSVIMSYLWKTLDIMGMRPDPRICVSCGRRLDQRSPVAFSEALDGFLCSPCADAARAENAGEIPLDILVALDEQPFASWQELADSNPPRLDAAKRFILPLAQRACEGTLLTLRAYSEV